MSALLSVAQLRRTVQTDLGDSDLSALIAEEEAEIVRRFGAHGDGSATVTEVMEGGGRSIFLSRPIASVTSVAERAALEGSDTTLAASSYVAWTGQGRIERIGARWGARVSVVYVPKDDRPLRRAALAELVRLRLEQTALQVESVAGEYSYTAPPDWEQVRARTYRRLRFMGV